jgi:hypothetical protein
VVVVVGGAIVVVDVVEGGIVLVVVVVSTLEIRQLQSFIHPDVNLLTLLAIMLTVKCPA